MLWLGLYSVTLNAAERTVDAGTAAMLISTGTILIAVLAGICLKEGFPPELFAGCAIAFTGCVVIALATTGNGNSNGIVYLVIAAVAYSTAVVIQKPVLQRVSSFRVTFLGCAAAGQLASLTYLIPVIAIVIGYVVLNETPPKGAVAGGALCLAGAAVASTRRSSRRRRPEPGGR